MIKFSSGMHNKKLRALAKHLNIPFSHVYSFDIPAGYTCKGANICKSFANRQTGHIIDKGEVRCYAASQENYLPNVRAMRWENYNTLLQSENMLDLINLSIPQNAKVIRIHASGDFFNDTYFLSWVNAALCHPDITFFGYSKMLKYVTFKHSLDNLHLIYSHGGLYDNKADSLGISQVYIVNSAEQAALYNAPIICDNPLNDYQDYDYIINNKSFCIKIHGTQRKGFKRL